jgi:general secretion pathway protein H
MSAERHPRFVLRRARRAAQRGMTLIEIMIVMIVIAVVMAGVVMGSGQLGMSRLKHTATAITGASRVAFTRATATSKSMRLVFDIDASTMWLEEGDSPMLVQSKDTTSTGGADPVTAAEKRAVAEGEAIVKGPRAPRAHFHAVNGISITADVAKQPAAATAATPAPEASASSGPPSTSNGGKGPISLPRGIKFREIQTAHDDAPRTSGRAYLYYWPGGLTERASIQIRMGDSTDDSDTLTLVLSPLTGKITVKSGPVALVMPLDDKEASEREDNGGF